MRVRGLPAVAIVLAAVGSCAAQTVTVDITPSHVKNTIIPNQALGAGIDRISQKTVDSAFTKSVIDRVLEAG